MPPKRKIPVAMQERRIPRGRKSIGSRVASNSNFPPHNTFERIDKLPQVRTIIPGKEEKAATIFLSKLRKKLKIRADEDTELHLSKDKNNYYISIHDVSKRAMVHFKVVTGKKIINDIKWIQESSSHITPKGKMSARMREQRISKESKRIDSRDFLPNNAFERIDKLPFGTRTFHHSKEREEAPTIFLRKLRKKLKIRADEDTSIFLRKKGNKYFISIFGGSGRETVNFKVKNKKIINDIKWIKEF